MKSKILILLLVAAFAISAFAITAFATEAVQKSQNNLYLYTVDDNNIATITKYLGQETNVTINRIDGKYTVGKIGYGAFAENTAIESVKIYSSVSEIGESAFEACTSLEKVTFVEGSKLTAIGDFAFYDCISLKEINLPKS